MAWRILRLNNQRCARNAKAKRSNNTRDRQEPSHNMLGCAGSRATETSMGLAEPRHSKWACKYNRSRLIFYEAFLAPAHICSEARASAQNAEPGSACRLARISRAAMLPAHGVRDGPWWSCVCELGALRVAAATSADRPASSKQVVRVTFPERSLTLRLQARCSANQLHSYQNASPHRNHLRTQSQRAQITEGGHEPRANHTTTTSSDDPPRLSAEQSPTSWTARSGRPSSRPGCRFPPSAHDLATNRSNRQRSLPPPQHVA